MFALAKIIVSAVIIGIITEVSRRFPTFGGIIAALPLVSLLSLSWLYIQGEQTKNLSKFVFGVLWGLPATFLLLFIVAWSLKASYSLMLSIVLGIGGWGLFLIIQSVIFKNI